MRISSQSPTVKVNSDKEAASQNNSSAANTNLSIEINSTKVNLSKASLPQELFKHLLPENYSQSLSEEPNMEQIAASFISYSDNELKNTDPFFLLEKGESLEVQSINAHKTVREIFTQLGQLDDETDKALQKSSADISVQLGVLTDNYRKFKPTKGNQEQAKFHVEMNTLEGDKVVISFGEKNYSSASNGLSYGLGMQIEGDISKQEAAAISRLYQDIENYIQQTLASDRRSYSTSPFDLSESFDSSVLSKFKIDTDYSEVRTEFSYQVDLNDNTRKLSTSRQGRSEISYNMDIESALDGSASDKEKVLETLEKSLQRMDVGGVNADRVNQFILGSLDSMLSTEENKSAEKEPVPEPDSITVASLNQFIQKRDVELKLIGLEQFNEVPDYNFSLKSTQSAKSGNSHDSSVKMSQQTEMKLGARGLKAKQTQTNEVDIQRYQHSWNRLAQKTEHWILDEKKEVEATFNHSLELMKHQVSGHKNETLETSYFDKNYVQRIDVEKQKQTYSQTLQVLDEKAKLTTQQKDTAETINYVKEEHRAKVEIGRSRLVREYEQVLDFVRKSKR